MERFVPNQIDPMLPDDALFFDEVRGQGSGVRRGQGSGVRKGQGSGVRGQEGSGVRGQGSGCRVYHCARAEMLLDPLTQPIVILETLSPELLNLIPKPFPNRKAET